MYFRKLSVFRTMGFVNEFDNKTRHAEFIKVVVPGPWDPLSLLGFAGGLEQSLSLLRRYHAVLLPLKDENRSAYSVDLGH